MPEKPSAHTVIANIRKVREFRNYSQQYIALKLNISQNAYCKIELGRNTMSLTRLIQVADVLGVDITDLLKEADALFQVCRQRAAAASALRDGE